MHTSHNVWPQGIFFGLYSQNKDSHKRHSKLIYIELNMIVCEYVYIRINNYYYIKLIESFMK